MIQANASVAYGPHKTPYTRCSERGVVGRMMEGLAAADAEPKTIMINATVQGRPHGPAA
ncbi:hypothetical protein [Sphingomonas sp. PP-F2F-G114-C0414]|uniref:hypothetical protein n=1 Tax=Sphingomonas sp. PP-F2F-G114-C0414 TaxID=2135662 RepID=UPI001604B94B